MSSLSSPALQDAAQRPQLLQRLRRLALPAVALGIGPLALALLKRYPALDLMFESAVAHFWVVTAAALLAVCLALVILRAAVARGDGRVLLIGSAFLGISLIFVIHAIATPNVLFTNTRHATTWSTPIALAVGAVLLALSTWERFAQQAWLARRWRGLLLGGALLWSLYAGFMLVYVPAHSAQAQPVDAGLSHHAAAPDADDSSYGTPPLAPASSSVTLQSRLLAAATTLFGPLYGAIMLLYLGTALMYGWRWYQTPTRPLAALAAGSLLLAETASAAYIGVIWHISFWLYHALLLAAVITVTYGVVGGYQRGGALSSAVSGWLLRSTLQRQQAAVQHAMTILLSALEHGSIELLPQRRPELRQRFGLADDQLDLLEHAVQVVAQEREEQQRLRALTEVSRAATLNLDPDLLLHSAVTIFGETTEATLCAVGVVDAAAVTFKPEHCYRRAQPFSEALTIPSDSAPDAWFRQQAAVEAGPLVGLLAPLGLDGQPALQIPLLHHDQVLGVLLVQPRPGAQLDERMIDVCRSMSSQLATALVNARLYQALQRKHENLLQSEQAREQLTQMVVHDLKNPLTAIRGYHTLLRMTSLTAEQQELVLGAHRSSSTMLQLVTDILDIARLEEGRLDLRPTPTRIATLLEECRVELESWAEQEQKQVTIDVPAAMPPLLLDSALIGRVVTNLLSNAIKHTPPRTPITLGADIDAQAARLWVRDTGRGIAPEDAERLFDRFSATPSENRQQSNTGLGLTFCKLVVEAHHGTITVESAPGQGTTFRISLPAAIVVAPEHEADLILG